MAKMQANTDKDLGLTSEEIINECMIISALESTELALNSGLSEEQIIISCKVSRPRDLISIYRALATQTSQPLHLGLTEAGMGLKGLVWSAAAMGTLLSEGIGDTIRVSLLRVQTGIAVKKFTPHASYCSRFRSELSLRVSPPARAAVELLVLRFKNWQNEFRYISAA